MKTFDLTFQGTVLPEHDSEQVKQDFALLFCIDDQAVVAELFSGETIILKRELDRKTAAEYFSRISKLGAKAALVESDEQSNSNSPPIPSLEQENGLPPRVVRTRANIKRSDGNVISFSSQSSGVIHSAPQSAARDVTEKTGTDAQEEATSPKDDAIKPLEKAAQIKSEHSDSDRKLKTLRANAQLAEKRSQHELQKLQRKIDRFDSIAEQELERLTATEQETRERAQQRIAQQQAEGEQAQASLEEEIARLQQEISLRNLEMDRNNARFESLKLTKTGEANRAREAIEKTRKAIQLEAEQDICRLEKEIVDSRKKAARECEEIAQQAKELDADTRDAIKALDLQLQDSQDKLQETILVLQKQQEDARLRTQQSSLQRNTQHRETLTQKEKELAALQSMKQHIHSKREEGINEAREAISELQGNTRREREQLGNLENPARERTKEVTGESADTA